MKYYKGAVVQSGRPGDDDGRLLVYIMGRGDCIVVTSNPMFSGNLWFDVTDWYVVTLPNIVNSSMAAEYDFVIAWDLEDFNDKEYFPSEEEYLMACLKYPDFFKCC